MVSQNFLGGLLIAFDNTVQPQYAELGQLYIDHFFESFLNLDHGLGQVLAIT